MLYREAPWCYTQIVPTKHPRISVTADDDLSTAIEQVRPLFPDRPAAWIVRALALEGAESLQERERTRAGAIERLIAVSTGTREVLDLAVLERVDDLAWS